MTLRIDGAGTYSITISEEVRKEGILLKVDRATFDSNGEANFRVKIIFDDEGDKGILTRGEPIEGHPNCFVGDCNTCHNVACGIYQGYEPMP